MAAPTPTLPPLYRATPLLYSPSLSTSLSSQIHLKLEILQPPQSFKARGLSLFAQRALAAHGPSVHLIAASGGNAGLAAAWAAKALGVRCTVYLPMGASEGVKGVLKRDGAEVVEVGENFGEALREAERAVREEDGAVLVPAYDDPTLWEGHSTLIHEVHASLPSKPSAIFCSVGGGGLLGGVLLGLQSVGWSEVPVIALETHGSNAFHLSMLLNSSTSTIPLSEGLTATRPTPTSPLLAHLPRITSRATSLGASVPAAGVVQLALDHPGGVTCVSVPDWMAMKAGVGFADTHKFLIELACSTTLVPAFFPALFDKLVPPSPAPSSPPSSSAVFVVCGGSKITLSEMSEYASIASQVELGKEEAGEVWVGGERVKVESLPHPSRSCSDHIARVLRGEHD